ncbi:hypothetical protein GCM10011529_28710 [Polymorphobacter glacialis]|uniref:DUF4175 domain-containing protein n=1 Tax=Sandarakinorhabdus glacialis TaxID=1614636 RepID=A0A917A0R9_9SPHN|nr:hypothetical protein [Polymorphobacter glacialis]GGE20326.1 hypothetical protein GCM10011529_28710 [Polymorphobacter glacialis]
MMYAARAGLDQVLALGARYGVAPLFFAAIYIGVIPFFLLFFGLAVRRLRAAKPAVLWIVAAGLCFVSAYLYLAVAGRGIPALVWVLLAVLAGYGAFNVVRSARRKLGGR